MKIRASVRKICEKCRLIRRRTKETFYHKGVYKKFWENVDVC